MVRKAALGIFASVVCLLAQSVNSGNTLPAIYPPPNEAFQELKDALALTNAQLDELRKIMEDKWGASRQVSEQIIQKQNELNNLLQSGSRDVNRIGQLTLDIHLLSTQQPAPDDQWRQRALAVLTPDQRTKLGPLDQAMKLSTPAYQAVTLNLIAPPPPGKPIIMPGPAATVAGGAAMPLPQRISVMPAR